MEGVTVCPERAERCNYQLNFSMLVEDRPLKINNWKANVEVSKDEFAFTMLL